MSPRFPDVEYPEVHRHWFALHRHGPIERHRSRPSRWHLHIGPWRHSHA